jgi:rSAM/selenodomain-associated transferase 1
MLMYHTMTDRLLLFTRFPEAGTTKTRLIPALGPDGAAGLHKRLAERTAAQAALLAARHNIQTAVHYSGGSLSQMTDWLGPLTYVTQAAGDLGRRMQAAFQHAFGGGAARAVLIGSDIPGIDVELLARAFAALETAEVVLGPCRDGGYYLLGLTAEVAERLYSPLFADIPWSTGEVFAITRERLKTAAVVAAILPILRDIDRPADLEWLRASGQPLL